MHRRTYAGSRYSNNIRPSGLPVPSVHLSGYDPVQTPQGNPCLLPCPLPSHLYPPLALRRHLRPAQRAPRRSSPPCMLCPSCRPPPLVCERSGASARGTPSLLPSRCSSGHSTRRAASNVRCPQSHHSAAGDTARHGRCVHHGLQVRRT